MVTVKGGTRPPWVGLSAGVWVQVASGNPYNFPLYSHSLKSVLGFNQRQITMLGVANDVGENVGILAGIACNHAPPWVVLLAGAVFCFLGYGVLWLALTRTVAYMPYWVLWVALCIATNSSAWLGTAVLVTNMRNFPLSRGTVASIVKGYGGVSAAVFTEIFAILLHNSSSDLLLFLALGIPILCIVLMYYVRPCTPALGDNSSEHCHFLFIQASSVVLGLYLLATTIISRYVHLSHSIQYLFIFIMVLLMMAPLCIPLKMTILPSSRSRGVGSAEQLNTGGEKTDPLLTPCSSPSDVGNFLESDSASDMDVLLAEGEGAVKKKKGPRRGDDFKFREAVVKADFWLLFVVYFAGVGSGITVLNNLAQVGIAQGVHDTTILLSLFGFCNFLGRLSGGSVSEYFVKTRTLPRTILMTFTQAMMVIMYLLFASALDGTLYVATAVLGICYGVQFSTLVPTASELFGLKNFGIIFNFMSMVNPLGALLFSGLLAGSVYDSEASKQGRVNCYGPQCFRLTFLVLAAVCAVGSMLSIVLTKRIKPVYEMLYAGGSFRIPQTTNH